MADFDIDGTFHELLKDLHYLPLGDVGKIKAAFSCAKRAHTGQKRASGEPYISHPLSVAKTTASWHLDCDAICAALLHDVLEDTKISKSELLCQFGKNIADLVDGLSKLDKLEFSSYQEAQAENFRKMLFAMAKDLRIVLIKLADRRHNLQTLGIMRSDKQKRIAKETQEIYAPIAFRLGLMTLYREFNDCAYQLIYPNRALVLKKAIHNAKEERQALSLQIMQQVQECLTQNHIAARVLTRDKGLFYVVDQMRKRHLSFAQVMDMQHLRVIVEDLPQCYVALGALHQLYAPIHGSIFDYVALPKANGYQSLHSALIGPFGTPIHVHIRTQSMHLTAEEGVLRLWDSADTNHLDAEHLKARSKQWLQSLLAMQTNNSFEFFENVKTDLFPDDVYVFTPKGRIYPLQKGACVLDFAYAVHHDLGQHAISATINDEPVELNHILHNGDVVKITTDSAAFPKEIWLQWAHTGRAKSHIQQFLRSQESEGVLHLGKNMIEQELLNLGMVYANIPSLAWTGLLQAYHYKTMEELYSDIGSGRKSASLMIRRLIAREHLHTENPQNKSALAIRGDEGLALQYATCCSPIPDDDIKGVFRQGRGLVVHCTQCDLIQQSMKNEEEKWLTLSWQAKEDALFDVQILIRTQKMRGVLSKISAAISGASAGIEQVNMDSTQPNTIDFHFTIQVHHRTHLAEVFRQVRNVSDVLRVWRFKEKNNGRKK